MDTQPKPPAESRNFFGDMMTAPPPPAEGKNGHWVKLGNVSVDSATMAITDPGMVSQNKYRGWKNYNQLSEPYGTGVQFWAGFGDGGYDVWAWVADYGKNDWADERIAQIVVTLIDAEDLKWWREQ